MSKLRLDFAIAGAGIYSDISREGYDARCAIVAGPKQQAGRVFT
jgi:hypothetical protein